MTQSSVPSAAVFDLNEDTVPDTIAVDTDSDGVADVEAFDLDADSVADVVVVDTNADGAADVQAFELAADAPAAVPGNADPIATPFDHADELADDSFTAPDEVTDEDLEQAQADLDFSGTMSDYAATNVEAASMDLS